VITVILESPWGNYYAKISHFGPPGILRELIGSDFRRESLPHCDECQDAEDVLKAADLSPRVGKLISVVCQVNG
jgi:hypothetical protein